MSRSPDSLVRIRLLLFERTLADTARAISGVRRTQEILDEKRNNQASIDIRREEVANRLNGLQDARWLANLLAFDRFLLEDLVRVRREACLVEDDLTDQRSNLSRSKEELARARAKLQVARNLEMRRRRAFSRRKERSGP